MGMRMGGDADPEDLRCSINRRKELCGMIECLATTSIVVAGITLIVEMVGNALLWAHWVADSVLPEIFYRFQTGWILFGVAVLLAIVMTTWEEYLQHKNANARLFYKSLTKGK